MIPDNKHQQMPSMGEMARNAYASAAEAINYYRQTKILVAQERETQRRLEICKSCEFIVLDAMRCTKCGCFMAVKTALASSNCPIGKW